MVPNHQIGFVAIFLIELTTNRSKPKLAWKFFSAARAGRKLPAFRRFLLPFLTDLRDDCFLRCRFFHSFLPFAFALSPSCCGLLSVRNFLPSISKIPPLNVIVAFFQSFFFFIRTLPFLLFTDYWWKFVDSTVFVIVAIFAAIKYMADIMGIRIRIQNNLRASYPPWM